MKVEIHRMSHDCWRLVSAAGETCVLDELPGFFESLDFKTPAGGTVKYKLLFFEGITGNDYLQYVGELYK